MTEKEKAAASKLFAKFIGGDNTLTQNSDKFYFNPLTQELIKGWFYTTELKFDRNWDWCVGVYNKFQELKPNSLLKTIELIHFQTMNKLAFTSTNIENLFLNLLVGVEWYNRQTIIINPLQHEQSK